MRTLILLSIIWLLFGAGARSVSAQAPSPPPAPPRAPPVSRPVADDLVWTVAQEPPLHDIRVAMALATLMTPQVQAAVGPSRRIVAVTLRAPDFLPETLPTGDVPLLLRAAGFPQRPPFVEVGPCKVWAAPTAAAPQGPLPPGRVVPLLGQALQDALHGAT